METEDETKSFVSDDTLSTIGGENEHLFGDRVEIKEDSDVMKKFTKKDWCFVLLSLTISFFIGFSLHSIFENPSLKTTSFGDSQGDSSSGNDNMNSPTPLGEDTNLANDDDYYYEDEVKPSGKPTTRPSPLAEDTEEAQGDVKSSGKNSPENIGSSVQGFAELEEFGEKHYLSEFKIILAQKNEKIISSNQDLKDLNIPATQEFDWDEFHVKACHEINAEFNPKLKKLDSKFKLRNSSDLFLKNWSTFVGTSDSNSQFGFSPDKVKELLSEMRMALARYYETTEEEAFKKIFDVTLPRMGSNEYSSAIDKIADLFVTRIVNKQPFVIAIYGSSVIAGQDNCWFNSYPKLLQRNFDRMFSVFGDKDIRLEVRPAGQNGDGCGVYPQIKCAEEILGEFDILQLGYWMISKTSQDLEALIRRALMKKRFVHSLDGFFLDSRLKGRNEKEQTKYEESMKPYYHEGILEFKDHWSSGFHAEGKMPWWPVSKNKWGRQGDGRCHIYTREGSDGTLMENWHPGPMGFQMMADLSLYLYSLSLTSAMNKLNEFQNEHKGDSKDSLFQKLQQKYSYGGYHKTDAFRLNNLPIVSSTCTDEVRASNPQHEELCSLDESRSFKNIKCYTGFGPQYGENSANTDLAAPAVDGGYIGTRENRNVHDLRWRYDKVKGRSNMRGNRDPSYRANSSVYLTRDECVSHPDVEFGWIAKNDKIMTDFIEFAIPEAKVSEIEVCTPTHKYEPYMDDISFRINDQPIAPELTAKHESCKLIKVPESLRNIKSSTIKVMYRGREEARVGFLIFN